MADSKEIFKVSINGDVYDIVDEAARNKIPLYGTCSTAAATVAKVVTLSGFVLATGSRIAVKFTVTNTATSPTLNVNSTGAKSIYYRGAAIPASYLAANRTYEFVYNGTQYELIGDVNTDTNTTYTAASATPLVAGTGAVGTSTKYAREDHVHPAQTTVSGNAGTATTLATARTIDGMSFNGSANITHYGTCSTAAATTAKTVSLTGFTLATGAEIMVKFTYTNTASAPTLNVNSTGAKSIVKYGTTAPDKNMWEAGTVVHFVYDGTRWVIVSGGLATMTVEAGEGVVLTKSGSVVMASLSPDVQESLEIVEASFTLADNSWSTIQVVAKRGLAANYWSVGDQKAVTLSGTVGSLSLNGTYNAFIIGFSHNSTLENGNNTVHFQFGKSSSNKLIAFCDSSYGSTVTDTKHFSMNSSSTNVGGWNNSNMRKTILGNSGTPTNPPANSFMAALPSDLRAVMKSVTKYTDNTGGAAATNSTAADVTATTDYLFLLAEFEYFGARTNANSYEQKNQVQYDYYKAGNLMLHYNHSNPDIRVNGAANTAYSWTRSPRPFNSYFSFCCVSDRSPQTSIEPYANKSYGISPAFAVG